jgi:DHA3 family macrolide efflux protein-like MFS transporter
LKTTRYNLDRWKPFFFIIWGGQVFSLFGSVLVDFALVWYMTVTTGSAIVLTTATLALTIPQILLSPLIGGVVDRFSRRTMIIVADGAIAVFTLIIALLFYTGAVQIWHIYVLILLRAIAGSAHHFSLYAATSLMVPEEQLARVAGLNQSLYAAMSILGPPAGAFLLERLQVYGVLLIDIVTAAIAITPILFIVLPELARQTQKTESGAKFTLFDDLVEGFRFIRSWKGLMGVIIMAALAITLVTPIFSLIPLLVTRHFGGGAVELGWLEAVMGAGTIAGGLILGAWGGFKKRIVSVICGGVVTGLGILIVAVAPADAFWLALVGFSIMGISNAFINGPLLALIQARVAPELQGRVNGFLGSATQLATPVTLLVSGSLADLIDIRIWFFIAGAGAILIHLAGAFVPAIMSIEDEKEPERAVI